MERDSNKRHTKEYTKTGSMRGFIEIQNMGKEAHNERKVEETKGYKKAE